MILADLINVTQVLPFAIFGIVAIIVWCVLDMSAGRRNRAVERLDELTNPSIRRRKAAEEATSVKKADAMSKVLAMASPALARPLRPKNEFEASKLKMKLAHAGFRGESSVSLYLGLKFVGLLVGIVASGISALATASYDQKSLMTAVMVIGLLFYLPDLVIKFISKKRKESIFLSLPDALDLMVVCVEAGLGLDQAMRKVADEMKKSYRVIAKEFALSNFQLQMGRAKAEVLHELGARSGVDDLRSLAAILIQADKFGSSVAQALRVQSDSMRTRRRQLAEEKAAKTAVKLIFPLVLFIFPGIFVVLVGPAAITMVREMFPVMQNK